MGASQHKRRAFLAKYPRCFFCDDATSETIDHIPSRECFKGRIGPEGFEFPSCSACNAAYSRQEQIVALYIRLFNHDNNDPPGAQLEKLFRGVRNNDRICLPHDLTANEKRRGIKSGHLHIGDFTNLAELPMVGFPEEGHRALEAFARKLTCALYYKHSGLPVPKNYFIMTMRTFTSEKRADEIVKAFVDMLPEYKLGSRTNTSIGEQFHYRYGLKQDNKLFAFVAQFANALYIIGGVSMPREDLKDYWKSHMEDFRLLS